MHETTAQTIIASIIKLDQEKNEREEKRRKIDERLLLHFQNRG